MINTFTDKMTYHTKKKLGLGILSVQIHVKTTRMPVNYLVHLDNIAVVLSMSHDSRINHPTISWNPNRKNDIVQSFISN